MQELFRTDPQAKIRYENTRRELDEKVRLYLSDPNARLFRTNAIINVPVVVHIATANPAQVTDATVQSQIDTLNWYYGGAPVGDSLRVYTPFRTSYGRSQIRFCLAQRTPAGLPSNGIERTTTSMVFSTTSAHPSTVVPAWNTQLYLNMWVVNFGTSGVLGYSYKPGAFPAGSQNIGYVVDYRAFGSGAAYEFPEYNQGKTGVHEIGHYFNLDHPWGPNNNGNPTCTLSDGCSDTPPTSGPYFGCPTAAQIPITNACSPTAPGIMWQNHMDYADDACMVLFTKEQVVKMETALTTAPDRNTLLASNGCQAVVALPNDAGISAIVTPANGSAFCSPSVTPVVTLRNYGSLPLTSVTITLTLNTVAQTPYTWTGTLAPNATVNVTLPAITLAAGNNTIRVATSNPNGVADGTPSNDATTVTVSYATGVLPPVVEGFEGTFPPTGWTVINPNGDATWVKTTPGRNSASSMFINNYDVDATNNIDDFRSSPISTAAVTTLTINFDLAHKNYPSASFSDTLSVLVSKDCGATYQTVYKKWGATLATAGSSTAGFTTPTAANWRNEAINVTGSILSGSQVIVVFRNTSRYGNNIFIDNINIQKQTNRDLKLVSINNPASTACSPLIAPSVTILNNGSETVTSFQVGYRIDNGAVITTSFPAQNFAPGATITVPLTQGPAITPGDRTITAFTFNPTSASGSGDVVTSNDTLSKAFTLVALVNPPVVEGFELNFPPAGWAIINPTTPAATWIRKSPGRNSANAAFIDNYNNLTTNEIDDLKTPFVNVNGADSLIMRFDLAHKNYPVATSSDTLTVLMSTDCGNTYTSVYKKWGATLATAGSSTADYTTPAAGDWRNERIALGATYTASGNVNILIRNTNRFGNNIFIDNVNIASVFKRDVALASINQPSNVVCNGAFTPSVTLRNTGLETITAVKVNYSIDNGAVQTSTFTGLSLARDAETTLNLTAANVAAVGAHTIRVYSYEPVSASGTGDLYTANDTLTKAFSVAGTVAAPLSESFVSTTFPPTNWSVVNPDNSITWKRSAVGNGNAGSAYVNTFNYSVLGQQDDLVSPNVTFSGVDSVTLKFDVASHTYSYPGSTDIPLDTLEVMVTKNCGATFTTVYKKWGDELQTVNDPNNGSTDEFIPNGNVWRTETVDLTGFGGSGPLMVYFRTTNNFENNVYIDNVNLTTRTLPTRIKQQGYLVLPSPFQNSFSVWHLQQPSTLKYINVYNSVGQLIWTKKYSGNAQKVEAVDLTGKAAGIYVVKLGYDDENRNVSERVIKY